MFYHRHLNKQTENKIWPVTLEIHSTASFCEDTGTKALLALNKENCIHFVH